MGASGEVGANDPCVRAAAIFFQHSRQCDGVAVVEHCDGGEFVFRGVLPFISIGYGFFATEPADEDERACGVVLAAVGEGYAGCGRVGGGVFEE